MPFEEVVASNPFEDGSAWKLIQMNTNEGTEKKITIRALNYGAFIKVI